MKPPSLLARSIACAALAAAACPAPDGTGSRDAGLDGTADGGDGTDGRGTISSMALERACRPA